MLDYPFTQSELTAAHEEWGCSCGPAALAFALQQPLAVVRTLMPQFEDKHYTTPSMMKTAILAAEIVIKGLAIDVQPTSRTQRLLNLFDPTPAIVRIQWTGPWTKADANPKWAYRQTHWIATWIESSRYADLWMIFDVNCGMKHYGQWSNETVDEITKTIPRADGGWYPTHIWRLKA